MNIKSIKSEDLEKDFLVKFTKQDIETKKETWLKEQGKSLKIEGFRAGKIPLQVLKMKYDKQADKKVREQSLQDADEEIRKKYKLENALQAEFALEDDKEDFSFKLFYNILPDYKLEDTKKLKLDEYEIEVPKKEIDDLMLQLREKEAERKELPKGGVIKEGYEVDITLTLFKNKKALESYNQSPIKLIVGTKRRFLDPLEDKLIGMKSGDEQELSLIFPKSHPNKKIAGKKFDCKIIINRVTELKLPAIGKELFKKFNVENKDQLQERVIESFKKDLERYLVSYYKRKVMDSLEKQYDFAVPERLVEREFEAIWKQFEQEKTHAEKNNYLLNELEGKTDKELKEEYKKVAARRVRLGFVINRFSREQNIRITEKELQAIVLREALKNGKEWEEYLEFIKQNPRVVQSLQEAELENKVIDYIHNNATLNKTKITPKEVYEKFEEIMPGFLA